MIVNAIHSVRYGKKMEVKHISKDKIEKKVSILKMCVYQVSVYFALFSYVAVFLSVWPDRQVI